MLKSLLSLLLSKFYSKQESALVAEQALPNESEATSLDFKAETTGTFVAPYDGYLSLVTQTGGSINIWNECLQISNFPGTLGQAKSYVPVRKGKTVTYNVKGTLLMAKLYKQVGGGIKLLRNLFCKEVQYA